MIKTGPQAGNDSGQILHWQFEEIGVHTLSDASELHDNDLPDADLTLAQVRKLQ